MISKILIAIMTLFIILSSPSPVSAQNQGSLPAQVQSLMERGYVGEREDGYLGFVGRQVIGSRDYNLVEGTYSELLRRINAERRQQYERQALQNGVPLQRIELAAGRARINALPTGYYYRRGGAVKRWVQK